MAVNLTRIHGHGWREQIGIAHAVIGPRMMRHLGHVQYVMGVDPVFIGLHGYEQSESQRSYRDTAHCLYPFHVSGPADRRVTTIVMPRQHRNAWTAHTIVHELGHALHEVIGFDHEARPVTEYARTNRYEAFAEAFTSWAWPGNGYDHVHPADEALLVGLEQP